MALRALCLCDGYGGFELGLRGAGFDIRTVARVERDSYAAAVLVERMEEERLDRAPIWDDLTTFDGAAWRGRVDLITAGFPCQPFSAAGAQRGVDDDRWLWPAIGRIIGDVGPRFVFLENVPGLVRAGMPHVLADLADLGFDAEWGLYSASNVGASHQRQRIWILAMENAAGIDGRKALEVQRCGSQVGATSARTGERVAHPPLRGAGAEWDEWIASGGPQPTFRRSADGAPTGLADALHLGGNGLVPAAAGEAFRQLLERMRDAA